MDIKNLIIHSRKARKWTQIELSDRAKVAVNAIKNLESGKDNVAIGDIYRLLMVLNHKSAERLETALKFNPADFFTDPVRQIEFMEECFNSQRVRKNAKN